MTTEAYQGNPRLRSVRIDVDGKSCQFMTDSQRVTMIPCRRIFTILEQALPVERLTQGLDHRDIHAARHHV